MAAAAEAGAAAPASAGCALEAEVRRGGIFVELDGVGAELGWLPEVVAEGLATGAAGLAGLGCCAALDAGEAG